MYKDGDLCIDGQKLGEFLKRVGPGEYTTFDLIDKYQGFKAINKGKNPHDSWNASFGRILKRYSQDHPEIIGEVQAKEPLFLDSRPTTSSRWEIFQVER